MPSHFPVAEESGCLETSHGMRAPNFESTYEREMHEAEEWAKEHGFQEDYFPAKGQRVGPRAIRVGGVPQSRLPSGESKRTSRSRWLAGGKLLPIDRWYADWTEFEEAAIGGRLSRDKRPCYLREALDTSTPVVAQPDSLEEEKACRVLMERLTLGDRNLLYKRFFDQMTLQQIADEQGVRYQTIQKKLARVLRTFKQMWVHGDELLCAREVAERLGLSERQARATMKRLGVFPVEAAPKQLWTKAQVKKVAALHRGMPQLLTLVHSEAA